MTVVRNESDINDIMNRCAMAEEDGFSVYPGMTYEQGIMAAIKWLTEPDADNPFDD